MTGPHPVDPVAALLPPTYLGGPEITTENCEREPIHIPGSVQPHGALLVVNAEGGQVLQVSENLPAFLGVAAPELPREALEPVLSLLTRLAVRRHGQGAVVSALARSERAPRTISAF